MVSGASPKAIRGQKAVITSECWLDSFVCCLLCCRAFHSDATLLSNRWAIGLLIMRFGLILSELLCPRSLCVVSYPHAMMLSMAKFSE